MKLTVNGKKEMVKIVELYCNITGWKLQVNNEVLEINQLSDWLKETKNLKELKSVVKDLIADLSFDLEMTEAEGKELKFYLLRELSTFLKLEEVWYIDSNSYERGFEDGFEDGANEGYSEISDKLIFSIREAIEQEKGSEKELNLLLKIGAKTLGCSEDEFNQML